MDISRFNPSEVLTPDNISEGAGTLFGLAGMWCANRAHKHQDALRETQGEEKRREEKFK